jgi:chromosomal replication initiator protein
LFGICGGPFFAPPGRRYGRDRVPENADRQQLDSLWRDVQRRLRDSVPDSTFDLWLQPLRVLGARGSTLHIAAPAGIRSWVERRYSALIREALEGAGEALHEISFDPVDGEGPEGELEELNPNYTFDRFVIGAGNRFAHAAALATAEAPSEAYNPLFLHGPPGLGKTHLLVAIANYLRVNAPELSVRYTTAESFTNEFVEALRASGADGFKRRYRDLDVLLVDDVQFLEGKPNTEEEFFHTFNALYEGGSQLVLSADRLPSELASLAERLRDRFEWGLTVSVEPPNLATRVTVLRRLIREAGIPDGEGEALLELAGRINANVRQLHGALTRVIAHASLAGRPLDSSLIAEIVPRSGSVHRPTRVEEIQERVAGEFGVSRAELVGSSRASAPLRARQVAILLTREGTGLSLPQIGRAYGGRDHSTVLNALKRIEIGISEDPVLADRVERLRHEIHSPGPGDE